MLAAAPGRWTQEDVLLASSPQVRGHDVSEDELCAPSRGTPSYFDLKKSK